MRDGLQAALSANTHIRFVTVEVTETARVLELRHHAGPVAGAVLAEGLAAAALLSVDAAHDLESVYVRLKVTGPIKGLMAEASGNGDLRGFPHVKALDALDRAEPITTHAALGEAGSAEVVRTLPGKILNQAMVAVNPPRLDKLLARYFNLSLQVPTGVAIAVRSDAAGVLFARGLVAQRMPDAASADFVKVLEAFHDGRVAARLAETEQLEAFRDLFDSPTLAPNLNRELRFRCRCTKEKITAVLQALPTADLDDMLAEQRDLSSTCHMCGEAYALTQAELRAMRDAREDKRPK